MKTTMLYSALLLSLSLTSCSRQDATSATDNKPEIQEIDGKKYYIYKLKDLWSIPVSLSTLGQPFLSGKGMVRLDGDPKVMKVRVPNPRNPNQPDITYKPTEDYVSRDDATAAQEYDTYVARKLLPSSYLSDLDNPVGSNAAAIKEAVTADRGVLGEVVRVPTIDEVSDYVKEQILSELNQNNPNDESKSDNQQQWTGSEKLDLMGDRHWAGVLYFRHPSTAVKKYFRVVAYMRADTGEIVFSKLQTDVQDDRLLSPIAHDQEIQINLTDYQPWQGLNDPRNRAAEYGLEGRWRKDDPAVWGEELIAQEQQAYLNRMAQAQAAELDDDSHTEQDMGE